MKRNFVILFALTCAASAAFAQPATTSSTTRPSTRPASQRGYSDRYGLLEQRNIFLRDRTKPTTQRSGSSGNGSAATQPVRRPEQMLFVRGIVLEYDGIRAYVEDTSTGASNILRVSPGDKLGPGRVVEIMIDALAYEQAGQLKWINVGSDLTGQETGAATATTSPTTGPAAGGLTFDPNDPNLTTEQRMRLRASQQRGGQ